MQWMHSVVRREEQDELESHVKEVERVIVWVKEVKCRL